MANMRLNNITLDRLRDREALLTSFDAFRRYSEASTNMQGMDSNTKKAFDVLTSSKLVEALDLEKKIRLSEIVTGAGPQHRRSVKTRGRTGWISF